MACGLSKTEAMASPFGEIQDLTAIYQIKEEGGEYKELISHDQEVIPDVP